LNEAHAVFTNAAGALSLLSVSGFLKIAAGFFALCLLAAPVWSDAPQSGCSAETYLGEDYIICRFDSRTDDIRLFLNDEAGAPYAVFTNVEAALSQEGKSLAFAMNAGMYRPDRSPAGLYIEGDYEGRALQIKAGPGNFGLLPNGVFSITGQTASVTETQAYKQAGLAPDYATQSGPMLVIEGAMHPKFRQGSTSKYRRNGVGVGRDGQAVYFAISAKPVNLHSFAGLFKDHLKTPNALYLDGAVSKLYAPDIGRADIGSAMGPIVGVVVEKRDKGE